MGRGGRHQAGDKDRKPFQFSFNGFLKVDFQGSMVELYPGELFARPGFLVTNMALPSRSLVRFYNKRGTAEQWIKEGKQATHWTRLSCHRFRANEVRLQLSVPAYNLGNLWRRLGLPRPIKSGSLTSLDLVGGLAKHGADLNARMKGPGSINLGVAVLGPTAFLAAAQNSDVDFMRTLVELGADPLLRDNDNKTALMLAGARMGTDDEVLRTMELALDLGVDIDAVDDNGETAIHAAAYSNRAEPIKLLAARGADIEIWNRENKQGSTPLAIAVGYRGRRSFRPQPEAEAAIREVMIAAGITPPEKVIVASGAP